MLYCPRCKVAAYRTHKCHPNALVPIKRELKAVVDELYVLSIDVMSASWFSFSIKESYYEHRITAFVELAHAYQTTLLGDLPSGWIWYTETVTGDHLPLSCLGYNEVFAWIGEITVEERIGQIVSEMVAYLRTRDPVGIRAVLLLSGS